MMRSLMANTPDRPVVVWLMSLWALVGAMVVLGGITRLTGSGLSMVEWRPLMGALPPMSSAAWHAVFEQYQATPQYEQVNHWMQLADFQRIFMWEYLHRLLGRGLGVVFALPFLWFLAKGRLRGATGRVGLAFLLGGAQGLLGWYMVKSGLVDVPEVSHYRLAAHLGLAFVTGGWLLGCVLSLVAPAPGRAEPRLWWSGVAGLGLLAIQVVWGAFMAGRRAGLLSATFPKMNGQWVPQVVRDGGDLVATLASNPMGIHFAHRTLGWLVLAVAITWGMAMMRQGGIARRWGHVVLAVVTTQFLLGVATVMMHVPTTIAVVHQLGGYVLVSTWLIALWSLRVQAPTHHRQSAPPASPAPIT